MPIDWPKVFEIEGFKQHARCGEGFKGFLGSFSNLININPDFRQRFQKISKIFSGFLEPLGGKFSAEERGEGADIAGYGHIVVI